MIFYRAQFFDIAVTTETLNDHVIEKVDMRKRIFIDNAEIDWLSKGFY